MGEKGYLATTAAFLAQAVAAQGRDREAEHFIQVSREAGAEEDASTQIVSQGTWARILASRGELAEAEELARAAVSLAERTDLLNQHADALLALAWVHSAGGRAAEARAETWAALGLYQRKGNSLGADGARRLLQGRSEGVSDAAFAVQQPGEDPP
jgi:tetratricopeptide (TPR) repeat protein